MSTTGVRKLAYDKLGLYAPFIAVVLVQTLLILTMPSRPAATTTATALSPTQQDVPLAGPGGSDTTVDNVTGSGVGPAARTDRTAAAPTDVRSCTKLGSVADRDLGIFCHPEFKGNNGGATSRGVTKDTIDIVWFQPKIDGTTEVALQQILGDLYVTPAQQDAARAAFTDWANAKWELYGRKLRIKKYEGDCPVGPQNYDTCIASAQRVIELKPFAVVWAFPLMYADVFDVWANAGILTYGGQWFPNSYFHERRPYRWDVHMDGDETMATTAELYCKSMAGRPASHAGRLIHPTIGDRTTTRHLGVLTQDVRESLLLAQHLRDRVKACTKGKDVPVIVASGNDTEQASANLAAIQTKLIHEKVTTFVCLCEVLSNSFITSYFTSNNYFPEHLVNGSGAMDLDAAGRLADPHQWAHAFGLSQLGLARPASQSSAAKVWRSTGHGGLPCGNQECRTQWEYLSLVGMGIQLAGPNLTPATVERAYRSAVNTAPAHPDRIGWTFGPSDYGFYSDVKIGYWDANATSTGDGKKGAFVPLDEGKRYRVGQIPEDTLSRVPVR